MNYAVKKYGTNTEGLPKEWPSETQDIGTATSLPAKYPSSAGWIFMTQTTLDSHKATHQAAYNKYAQTEKDNKVWRKLRTKRDKLLTESDWTQISDSQLSTTNTDKWKTYRQTLRDLPANTTDPNNPTFPNKPS